MKSSFYSKSAIALAALIVAGVGTKPTLGVAANAGKPSFTADQASKGKTAYNANCAVCHGAHLEGISGPALVGKDTNLLKETASHTYTYVATNMPVGNAGGLPKDVYVNVMAFLLQSNGHKAGSAKLTPDTLKASKDNIGAAH